MIVVHIGKESVPFGFTVLDKTVDGTALAFPLVA